MGTQHYNIAYWTRAAKDYQDVLNKTDLCRIYMPAVYSLLGPLRGKQLLDAGCGDGRFSKQMAKRGASVTAIDGAASFIEIAKTGSPHHRVRYELADLTRKLPFTNGNFDIVLANMVLMDLPKLDRAVREFSRILRPGGKLVFSIVHPCYFPFDWKCRGRSRLFKMVDDYLTPRTLVLDFWGRTLHFHRPLSAYLRLLAKNNFCIAGLLEPRPTQKMLHAHPDWEHHTRVPSFLIVSAIRSTAS
jgi:2-polyprenyl-3-methyl-5-hydroxy-6-metoxy-1,4-benzoquinol methylase